MRILLQIFVARLNFSTPEANNMPHLEEIKKMIIYSDKFGNVTTHKYLFQLNKHISTPNICFPKKLLNQSTN